jgi:hypothetical protein
VIAVLLLWSIGCISTGTTPATDTQQTSAITVDFADVVSVEAALEGSLYILSVGLLSPDVDCDQYADWWELLSPEGVLLYRRILDHSHATEQPFVRSSDPLKLAPDTPLLVRGHMVPFGYGGTVYAGTIAKGFTQVSTEGDFAHELEQELPLPDGCLF